MNAHTPTPWRVDPEYLRDIQSVEGPLEIASTSEFVLTGGVKPDGDTQRANAAFIVRACNAHDELVDALKLARDWVHNYRAAFPTSDAGDDLEEIDAAIAKAEGK